MPVYFIPGIAALVVNAVVNLMELGGTFWIAFLKGATVGIALGAMILGILYVTGRMEKLRAVKMRLMGKEEAAD